MVAHGPEGSPEPGPASPRSPDVEGMRLEKTDKDSETGHSVNRAEDAAHVKIMTDESAMAQLIGVGILEFGVILHRSVKKISIAALQIRAERSLSCSVLIGLTLAVNESFKILFVVIVFHRKQISII